MSKHEKREGGTGHTTSRNSAIFSVDDDISELGRQLRHNLETHFRPIFQMFVYGGERIASHDLGRLLHDPYYRDLLPPDKVYELVDLVDFNPGKAISYAEFVHIVSGGYDTQLHDVSFPSPAYSKEREPENYGGREVTLSSLSCLQTVCANTAPLAEVQDRLRRFRWWLPPPFFIVSVSIAQLVAFIYYGAKIREDFGKTVSAIDVVPAYSPLMYLPTRRQEAWRFLSYCLLHQGALDLVLTLLLQLLVGFPLEIVFSWWRLAIVYIVGILTGSLAQSVCDHYVGLAGGAGGCYAVVFGHVIAVIVNWSELNEKNLEQRKSKWWGRPAFRLFLIAVAVSAQTGLAIFRRFYPGYPAYKVGITAHIGGLIAGLLLGRSFLTDSVRYPWQHNGGWIDFFTFCFFFAACTIFNIVYKGYPDADYS